MRHTTELLAHLHAGALMALTFADGGAALALNSLTPGYACPDVRDNVMVCGALEGYAAQTGDLVIQPGGQVYRVAAEIEPLMGGSGLEDAEVPGLTTSLHTFTLRAPLSWDEALSAEQRQESCAAWGRQAPYGWGMVTLSPQGGEYVLTRQYRVTTPDPQAAHALLLTPHAQAALRCAAVCRLDADMLSRRGLRVGRAVTESGYVLEAAAQAV